MAKNIDEMLEEMQRELENRVAALEMLKDLRHNFSEPWADLIGHLYVLPESHSVWFYPSGSGTSAKTETVRALVKRAAALFGMGKKYKEHEKVQVRFTMPNAWDLIIRDYLPPTCQVVKRTRVIPAQEERVEEYEEVVCEMEGGEEAEATAAS